MLVGGEYLAKKKKKLEERLFVSRSHGSNLLEMTSDLATDSISQQIIQFIENSHDADAERVDIVYSPSRGELVISDNGLGMDYGGLKSFYRSGDSEKINMEKTPKGRKPIGKFGIATILLKGLTHEYTLTTSKKGKSYTVHELFKEGEELNTRKKLHIKEGKAKRGAHGTTITMRGLKFVEEDIEGLVDEISMRNRETLMLPDFNVFVNNRAVHSKSIGSSQEFKIDKDIEFLGRVHGSIYLTSAPTKMKGIHIYVEGVRYGNPQSFVDLGKLSMGIQNKIVGIIHADGLKKAVLLDKNKIKENHPGYVKLKKAITNTLYSIKHHMESNRGATAKTYVSTRIPRYIQSNQKRLVSAGIKDIDKNTKFKFIDGMASHIPGRYDGKNNIVYLNQNSPCLTITDGTKGNSYEYQMLISIIEILSLERLKRSKTKTIADLQRENQAIWDNLNGVGKSASRKNLHALALYAPADIARVSEVSISTVRYLLAKKVMNAEKGGQVTGKEFLNVKPRIDEMISLWDAVREIYGVTTEQGLKNTEKKIKAIGRAEPFIRSLIGTKGGKAYFIEACCFKDIKRLFKSTNFRLRKDTQPMVNAYKKFASQYISIVGLGKKLKGFDMRKASQVLDYARKHKIDIRRENKSGVKFHYGDFVNAYQRMRR